MTRYKRFAEINLSISKDYDPSNSRNVINLYIQKKELDYCGIKKQMSQCYVEHNLIA